MKRKGETMEATFYAFILIIAFLIVANYPLSDIVRHYARMLIGIMFLFLPIVILHKW